MGQIKTFLFYTKSNQVEFLDAMVLPLAEGKRVTVFTRPYESNKPWVPTITQIRPGHFHHFAVADRCPSLKRACYDLIEVLRAAGRLPKPEVNVDPKYRRRAIRFGERGATTHPA